MAPLPRSANDSVRSSLAHSLWTAMGHDLEVVELRRFGSGGWVAPVEEHLEEGLVGEAPLRLERGDDALERHAPMRPELPERLGTPR